MNAIAIAFLAHGETHSHSANEVFFVVFLVAVLLFFLIWAMVDLYRYN